MRRLGFDGPRGGGSHSYMWKEKLKVWVPSTDRDVYLLRKALGQAGITEEEWLAVA